MTNIGVSVPEEGRALLIAELCAALEFAVRVYSPAYHTTPLEVMARDKMRAALTKAHAVQGHSS